ncbi:MAG TPA: helix-turn-helix transcriptional regulator, partial [Kaistia sp.]|nr:helix-turn-helix transcriptional regulator [Kaistia sp.]
LVSDFRLTQAEIRLVLALERGDSLGAFAGANNLSLHTVRTHLKSIFSKTNTHRQHELVALTGRLRR